MNTNDLIGIPWKRDGMNLEDGGLNCWGLVKVVMARTGKRVPDFDVFVDRSMEAIEDQLRQGFDRFSGRFERAEIPEPGDVVAFSLGGDDLISHVGVVLDGTWFLHSRSGTGVRKSRLRSPMWRGFNRGYYRWNE